MATNSHPLNLSPGTKDAMPASRALFGSTVRASGDTEVYEFGVQGADGLTLVVDLTAYTAAASLIAKIEGVLYPDGPTGAAVIVPILTSAAFAAIGQKVLQVNPNMAAVTNLTAQMQLMDRIRVTFTPGDAKSLTYSATVILN